MVWTARINSAGGAVWEGQCGRGSVGGAVREGRINRAVREGRNVRATQAACDRGCGRRATTGGTHGGETVREYIPAHG
eukprot:244872-Chlamydomonas_euryale.AAC.2